MKNNGAVTGTITTSGGSYTIPAGYHNGSGKVTGPTLAALVGTSVTLTSNANLLTGNTAYGKNGVKYTGSMANKGAWTNTPTTKGKVTIPAGYHNGSGYVDTTSVYNKGYSQGIADGLSKQNIVYNYHKHTGDSSKVGGCYGNKSEIRYNYTYCNCTTVKEVYWPEWSDGPICGNCGHASWPHDNTGVPCPAVISETPYTYNYIGLVCGKNEQTIESVTIKY